MRTIEIKIARDDESQLNAAKLMAAADYKGQVEVKYNILSIVFEKSDAGHLKIVAAKMFCEKSQVGFTAYPIKLKGK